MALVDLSALTKVSTGEDRILPQPAAPIFKIALVQISVPAQTNGGSDKLTNGNRYDSIPLANGIIASGCSCQLVNYLPEEHDKFFEVLANFDGALVRCNPGHINAAGGDQKKFDDAIMEFGAKKPVWPRPDVMLKMGAKDALCWIKDMDFGLPDTLGYYEPEEMAAGFRKTIAFQPRVVKQNRGSVGEGIWIVKLKEGNYCSSYGERECDDSEMLILMEATDNHIEEHTVAEFVEFCCNGRTEKSGEWKSIGTGSYYKGGRAAGGQMVDQRYLPRISEGEARFLMVGTELYRVEHYHFPNGVGGDTITTLYEPDEPKYQANRKQLETQIPDMMAALGLDMGALPLIWAADFIPIDDHKAPFIIGEFNCSCLGIAGFLESRGKDYGVVKDADWEFGMKMCNLIGVKALEACQAWKY